MQQNFQVPPGTTYFIFHCVVKATIIFQEETSVGQSLVFKLLYININTKYINTIFLQFANTKQRKQIFVKISKTIYRRLVLNRVSTHSHPFPHSFSSINWADINLLIHICPKMVTHTKTICIIKKENFSWQIWSPVVKFGHLNYVYTLYIIRIYIMSICAY